MNDVVFVDRLVEAVGRVSDIAYYRRKLEENKKLIANVCGHCDHWMKSRECPREWNDNGRQRGPSMEDRGCHLFSLNARCQELHDQRQAEYVGELQKLGVALPSPIRKAQGDDVRGEK